jgi:hypothetical protein
MLPLINNFHILLTIKKGSIHFLAWAVKFDNGLRVKVPLKFRYIYYHKKCDTNSGY